MNLALELLFGFTCDAPFNFLFAYHLLSQNHNDFIKIYFGIE